MVKLVGILNVTPDSFSDGGRFLEPKTALDQAKQMFSDSAELVDVGAESTRPGAIALSPSEEWQRLETILPTLLQLYPGRISLDTHHPETVRKAVELGPIIVNDVTGMNNPLMVATVVELKPMVIISHLPGYNIQAAHKSAPVATEAAVKQDLLARAALLESKGLSRSSIILDPGIGFGKTMDLNRTLLSFARHIRDYPVMIGYSRKRFLGEKRLEVEPNLAAAKIAISSGAKYLRVHDVAAHKQLINES